VRLDAVQVRSGGTSPQLGLAPHHRKLATPRDLVVHLPAGADQVPYSVRGGEEMADYRGHVRLYFTD
jgi:hypothetical protein